MFLRRGRAYIFAERISSVAAELIVLAATGHFLLTYLLLDLLVRSAPSRVVTVSSKGHKYGRLDLDDVNVKRRWSALKAYCRSKTANVLFSTQLARLTQGPCRPVFSHVSLSLSLLPALELSRQHHRAIAKSYKSVPLFVTKF